jgi:hypothetical protein
MSPEANINRDNEVRQLAFGFWRAEGCPDGRDVEHWLRAEAAWLEQQQMTREVVKSPKAPTPAKRRSPRARQSRPSGASLDNLR